MPDIDNLERTKGGAVASNDVLSTTFVESLLAQSLVANDPTGLQALLIDRNRELIETQLKLSKAIKVIDNYRLLFIRLKQKGLNQLDQKKPDLYVIRDLLNEAKDDF